MVINRNLFQQFLVLFSGMGTTIQYAVNELATNPTSESFSASRIDAWDCFRSKALKEELESSVVNSKFKE